MVDDFFGQVLQMKKMDKKMLEIAKKFQQQKLLWNISKIQIEAFFLEEPRKQRPSDLPKNGEIVFRIFTIFRWAHLDENARSSIFDFFVYDGWLIAQRFLPKES